MSEDAPKPAARTPDAADAVEPRLSDVPEGPGVQIEDLLVAGLDRYFTGRHEDAIHIWTRVLFIDRGHARARAYIERARLALAERQREHDALVEHGVAAMGRGDTGQARELLAASLRDAAPDDRALAALARLDRLQHVGLEHAAAPARVPAAAAGARRAAGAARRVGWLPLGLILVLSVAAAVFALGPFGAFGDAAWWSGVRTATPVAASTSAPPVVITTGEAALIQARALRAEGRLRDAAQALAIIAPDDPRRAEADRLLTELQNALLGTMP